MATSFATIIAAVREEIGDAGVNHAVSDNRVAGAVRSGVRWCRGELPEHFGFAVAGLTDGQATVDSTLMPDLDLDGPYGGLLVAATLWCMAKGSMIEMAEKNFGSRTLAGTGASVSSRPAQHRLNAAVLLEDLVARRDRILGFREFTTGEV